MKMTGHGKVEALKEKDVWEFRNTKEDIERVSKQIRKDLGLGECDCMKPTIRIDVDEAIQILQWWGLSDSFHGDILAKKLEEFVSQKSIFYDTGGNKMSKITIKNGPYSSEEFEQGTHIIYESIEEWLEKGKELFGKDTSKWKFICPSCGNIQSVKSVLNEFPSWDEKEIKKWITQGCIGRQLLIIETKDGPRASKYCLWAANGLFKTSKTRVKGEDGYYFAVFDYVESNQD